jgi:hypothetical protein
MVRPRAISQYFSMQMDRRRYWYWIHSRILKYAWKWKSKTCFNPPPLMVDRTSLQTIIYDAILIALTCRGFLYLALPITHCVLTFPSLETSCKPRRRREVGMCFVWLSIFFLKFLNFFFLAFLTLKRLGLGLEKGMGLGLVYFIKFNFNYSHYTAGHLVFDKL